MNEDESEIEVTTPPDSSDPWDNLGGMTTEPIRTASKDVLRELPANDEPDGSYDVADLDPNNVDTSVDESDEGNGDIQSDDEDPSETDVEKEKQQEQARQARREEARKTQRQIRAQARELQELRDKEAVRQAKESKLAELEPLLTDPKKYLAWLKKSGADVSVVAKALLDKEFDEDINQPEEDPIQKELKELKAWKENLEKEKREAAEQAEAENRRLAQEAQDDRDWQTAKLIIDAGADKYPTLKAMELEGVNEVVEAYKIFKEQNPNVGITKSVIDTLFESTEEIVFEYHKKYADRIDRIMKLKGNGQKTPADDGSNKAKASTDTKNTKKRSATITSDTSTPNRTKKSWSETDENKALQMQIYGRVE